VTTPGQWLKVKEIVGAALEYQQSERGAFLDTACSEDEQLRAEVESLIAAYEQSSSLSANLSDNSWGSSLEQEVDPPAQIGPYRLERELGAGGMGQVWLAEQIEPVRRYVALKLIRAGFRDREIAQRFLAERQSLALMNHPSIAKIFDAGTTSAGQHYLVMEYVDGCPITEYCDRHKLQVAERLRLFQLVCEGVQHAHQKAIIHRDLKPSNILVTEVNGKPTPRIIDFGIAKALSPGLDEQNMFTRVGSVIGTMGYMSPEQAEGTSQDGGHDIDTRSDVYSLGILLYELLTGLLPFDQRKLTHYEMLRVLREQDAPRPSTRLRDSSDPLVAALTRSTQTGLLIRQLRGDADSITLKAIEKDRDRRYASPAELAADIERYLRNEPVGAHAASFSYLAWKYIRRHRVGVLVAAAGLLLLVGFAIAQSMQLRKTRRQRDRADRISQFMSRIFKVSNPNQSQGKTITARDLLDKGSQQISAELKDDPELEARMMYQMADTYYNLGIYPQAQSLAQQALSLQRTVLGPRNPDTLETMTLLGGLFSDEGNYKEAEKLEREQLSVEQRTLGSDNRATLRASWWLATTLSGEERYAEAEKLFRQTLSAQQRVLGPEDPQTLMSMDGLANTTDREGNFAEAEKQYRMVVEASRRVEGAENTNTLSAMGNLANTFIEQQRFSDAEKQYRDVLTIERRVYGSEHPDMAITLANLGTALDYEGKLVDADANLREALAIDQHLLGADNPSTISIDESLTVIRSQTGHYPEAKEHFLTVIKRLEKTDQPGALASAWYGLACAAAVAGHRDEAIDSLNKAVDHDLPSAQLISEPHFDSLHGDPRYEAVLARGQASTATVR
jgi:serine/threonine protein kinase